jgi:hypothetical protein
VRVQGNLARSTCPDEAGVDGKDAGTEGNVRGVMHGAWAVVAVGVHGMVQEDTHWGAVSRNHVGPLAHGFGSTRSRHPHPVAVEAERGRRLSARQCCYSQTVSVGSCCSQ